MKEEKDILDTPGLKQNPFIVREGYFDCIESRINDRIDNPATGSRIWTVAKPAIILAFSFLLIFGIGYGTLALTDTLGSHEPETSADVTEMSFESFMDNLYNTESESFNIDGQITEEEMFEFVSEYYSSQYIESYFAVAE